MSWLEGRQKQQGVGDAFVSFRVSSASWESVCVVGWSGLCSTHISSSGSRPYCVMCHGAAGNGAGSTFQSRKLGRL